MPMNTNHKLIPLFLALTVIVIPASPSVAGRFESGYGYATRDDSWTERMPRGNDRDDMRYLEEREYERRYRERDDSDSRRELRQNEEEYRERDHERERLRERFPEDRRGYDDRYENRGDDERRDRDDRETPDRDENRYENRQGRGYDDDEMSPAAREREWQRKLEQEQRELGRGSEQGQSQREEQRRKWWNFWD